ncbi:MAG TPA: hypothetical protein VMW24_21460, partial [Sedimentisphaerales bacterium]|nr:hypothetical protein [Sedimentisphaerales bacterium]
DLGTSVYVKKGTSEYVTLRGPGDTPNIPWISFHFDTQSIEENAAVINSGYEACSDGWYRIWLKGPVGVDNNMVVGGAISATAPVGTSTLGNSYLDPGNTFYVWGVCVEDFFVSSYIGLGTRAADNLVATIGTLDSPCTIAVDFRTGNGGIDTETIIQADDDSAGIDHSIRISRTAGDIIALIETATATVATLNCGALANNTVGKVVVTCADGAFNATLFDADDAVVAQATPDTSGTAPTGMTKLRYGVDHTPANWLYGHVTTVRTWDTAETAYLSEWPEFDPAVIGSMGGNNTVVYGPSSTPAGTISLPQLKRIHAKVQSDLARVSARPDLHRALKSRKDRRR